MPQGAVQAASLAGVNSLNLIILMRPQGAVGPAFYESSASFGRSYQGLSKKNQKFY